MSVQSQLQQVEELGKELQETKGERPSGDVGAGEKAKRPLSDDEKWARKNLRWQGGRPIGDIANALRVFERHEDYKGQFKFNEMVNRVLSKGTVMVDWRVYEMCAELQERFIPGLDVTEMQKALTIAACKTGIIK